ncbi:MAG: MgtC/SapB family protein [Oscillospiraceae bacterium]|nr:MgtC/SapB family protein [Oscillospiraceae bacterium]
MDHLVEIRYVTYFAVILRIVVAVILGGILGMEREMKNRAAGLRTYVLVCLGACIVMMTNQYIYQAFHTGDPVRLGAQVVSGIGFLGAGTIIVTKRSQIKGLTTAAGLWATAGLGLAIGIGFYEAALAGAVAILGIFSLMQKMDNQMRSNSNRMDVFVEINREFSLGDFLREVKELGIEASNFQRERESETQSEVRAYTVTLKMRKRRHHTEVLADLFKLPGVEYLEEL